MPLFMVAPLMGRYLSFREREQIATLKAQGVGVREIARQVGRDPSTISGELRRNAATRGGKLDYRASVAQWKAELLARRPKTAKLVTNDRLREYVQERFSGQVHYQDGRPAAGPVAAPWKGRNKPRRQDRRWVTAVWWALRTAFGRPPDGQNVKPGRRGSRLRRPLPAQRGYHAERHVRFCGAHRLACRAVRIGRRTKHLVGVGLRKRVFPNEPVAAHRVGIPLRWIDDEKWLSRLSGYGTASRTSRPVSSATSTWRRSPTRAHALA
jgi:hypothetical protein